MERTTNNPTEKFQIKCIGFETEILGNKYPNTRYDVIDHEDFILKMTPSQYIAVRRQMRLAVMSAKDGNLFDVVLEDYTYFIAYNIKPVREEPKSLVEAICNHWDNRSGMIGKRGKVTEHKH